MTIKTTTEIILHPIKDLQIIEALEKSHEWNKIAETTGAVIFSKMTMGTVINAGGEA